MTRYLLFNGTLVLLLCLNISNGFYCKNLHQRRPLLLCSTSIPADKDKQQTISTSQEQYATTDTPPDMVAFANGYKTAFTELPCQACSPSVGRLPDDLQGTYFRSGPAMFSAGSILPPKKSIVQPKQPPVPDGTDPARMVLHPMEGDGAIVGITIDGKEQSVTARFRYVRTIAFTAERKKGMRLYTGMDKTRQTLRQNLGNDLPLPLYRHHLQPGLNKLRKNTSNTRAVYWGKRLITMWEGGQPYKLDALALSTAGRSRLGGAIPKDTDPFGSKMVYDPTKETALFYAVDATPVGSAITLYEFDNAFKLISREASKVAGYAVINDFCATENYAVFVQPSMQANGVKYLVDKSPANVLSADPNSPATLHLLPRFGSSNNSPSQSAYSIPVDDISDANLHFCNAYETDNEIILDVIRSDSSNISDDKGVPSWPWAKTIQEYQSIASKKSLWRYTLNAKTGQIEKKLLTDQHCLFATINPKKSTRQHRYIYMNVGSLGSSVSPPQGITKFDCETSTMQTWMPKSFEFCGEPMFASRRGSSVENEDDGYILSILYNGVDESSEMIILDAKNVEKGPITRIPLGVTIPHGLFGCFTDEAEATWSYDTIERRAKLADKMESQGNMWNEVKSDFSGLGLRLDDMEEYFGDWNPFA